MSATVAAQPTGIELPVASTAAQHRVEWIDELRGIAALAVALVHSMTVLWLGLRGQPRGHGLPQLFDRVMAVLSIPAHYGYAGVMLFFLLSGFVIHLPFAGGRRPFEFVPYLTRRFFRIYPPYLVALLISLAIGAFLPSAYVFQLHLTSMDMGHVLRSFFLLQNYPHGGGPGMELAAYQPASNMALWSLPVEMELYLAYPLLLLGLRAIPMARLALGVAAVSIVATIVDVWIAAPDGSASNVANFQPTFLHYWVIWAAGAWLAERVATRTVPAWRTPYWIALGILTVAALLARPKFHLAYDFEEFLWAGVFFLAFLRLLQANVSKKFAVFRPLAGIGLVSYSLYLIHVPTFLVIAALWGLGHTQLSANFGFCLVAVALVVPVAAVMYVLVERPSIALGRRLSERKTNGAVTPHVG
jgi:peptidoglycan/LPS O-acetylase OafA/YrhL